MREKGSLRWLEALPLFLESYNNTVHSRIGLTPNAAAELKGEDVARLFQKLYGRKAQKGPPLENPNPELRVGRMVRISKVKGIFDKGYMGQWTVEHFIISEVLTRHPRFVYKLVDIKGRPIRGIFYAEELQPIEANRYIVEEVLREKRGPRAKNSFWLSGLAGLQNTIAGFQNQISLSYVKQELRLKKHGSVLLWSVCE